MARLTYPLSDGSRDAVLTTSGRRVSEITLDAVLADGIGADDVRVSPDTLRLQADDELLEFYELLRPGRATAAQMDDLASGLDAGGAPGCAALVREARAAYVRRGLTA